MGLIANWWAYTLLFLAVAASWAGVPMIGATAAAAAGAAASQGTLELGDVIVVATLAGEAGGLVGYAIGSRWGRALLGRPGKHLSARQAVLEKGEHAYARWGRLAVFFTPAIVSGTARMQRGQFVVWNLLASLAFSFSVCASSYGVGRLVSGHAETRDVGILLGGLVVGVGFTWVVHRRRRARARRAAPPTEAAS
jgi:membrane protein DedA with SNARE-associated domain